MKRIVVFGRTGAGKSSLGNRIFGTDQFKEGHTLVSETTESQEKVLNWPNREEKVSYIDTPGFADNRAEISNQQIIKSIFGLLKNLKGGVNVALFCLAAKSRIDAFDMDEIKMLQTILGEGIFNHLYIVITRMDTFEENTRKIYYKQIPEELPELLEAHGIRLGKEISLVKERILFSDFSDFEVKFLNPLYDILNKSDVFKPDNSLKLEEAGDDNKFLRSEAMKTILERYKGLFRENEQQLTENIDNLQKRGVTTAFMKKQLERKEKEREQLQEKIKHLDQLTENERILSSGKKNYEKSCYKDQESTFYEFLQNKKLVSVVSVSALPLQITRGFYGKNLTYSPHTHQVGCETDNFEKAFESERVVEWRVWIQKKYGGFQYWFAPCPQSGKGCILLLYKGYLPQDPPRAHYLIDLRKDVNREEYQEYICKLDLPKRTFTVQDSRKELLHTSDYKRKKNE